MISCCYDKYIYKYIDNIQFQDPKFKRKTYGTMCHAQTANSATTTTYGETHFAIDR